MLAMDASEAGACHSDMPPSRSGTRNRGFGSYTPSSSYNSSYNSNNTAHTYARMAGNADLQVESMEGPDSNNLRTMVGRRSQPQPQTSPYLQPPKSSQGSRNSGMQHGPTRRHEDRALTTRLSSPLPSAAQAGRLSTPPATSSGGRLAAPVPASPAAAQASRLSTLQAGSAAPAQQGRQKLLQAYGVARQGRSTASSREGCRGMPRDTSGSHAPDRTRNQVAAEQHLEASRPNPTRPPSARPGSARPPSARPGSAVRDPFLNSMTYDDIPDVTDGEHACEEEQACFYPTAAEQEQQQEQQYDSPGDYDGGGADQEERGYGMTLDQYMLSMITTPASAAATSGLGQIAGSSTESSPRGYHVHEHAHVHDHTRRAPGAPHQPQQDPDDDIDDEIEISPAYWHSGPGMGPGSRNSALRESAPAAIPAWRSASWRSSAELQPLDLEYSQESLTASALAFSNSLDLRPATAAAPSLSSDRGSGGASSRRQDLFEGHMHDTGDHGDLIKETDLGGLASALFTPNANQRASAQTGLVTARHVSEVAGSPSAADGLARLSARRPSGMDDAAGMRHASTGVSEVGAAAAAAAAAQRESWASRTQSTHAEATGGDAEAEARAEEVQAGVGRGMRLVQSARPVTRNGGPQELDPSVWQNTINAQLERPPSRQKPPPEALHLWAPGERLSGPQNAMRLGPNNANGIRVRPRTAAASTYRSRVGPSVQVRGNAGLPLPGHGNRPPTRQKPPPMSVLLEHSRYRSGDRNQLDPPSEESDADFV